MACMPRSVACRCVEALSLSGQAVVAVCSGRRQNDRQAQADDQQHQQDDADDVHRSSASRAEGSSAAGAGPAPPSVVPSHYARWRGSAMGVQELKGILNGDRPRVPALEKTILLDADWIGTDNARGATS